MLANKIFNLFFNLLFLIRYINIKGIEASILNFEDIASPKKIPAKCVFSFCRKDKP